MHSYRHLQYTLLPALILYIAVGSYSIQGYWHLHYKYLPALTLCIATST